jgi:polyferredoxin
MFIQIAIGSLMLIASIAFAALTFWLLEHFLTRAGGWMTRRPHRPKLVMALIVSSVAILGQVTVSVWMWAGLLWSLDLFHSLEMSVYFALTCFTTLGFGDVLLPQEWRLLGGLAATNSLVNIGVVTAVMVETLRFIRMNQIQTMRPNAS